MNADSINSLTESVLGAVFENEVLAASPCVQFMWDSTQAIRVRSRRDMSKSTARRVPLPSDCSTMRD